MFFLGFYIYVCFRPSVREFLLFTSDSHERNTSFHYLYVGELAHMVNNPFWDWQAAVTRVSVNLTKLLLPLIDIGSGFEFKNLCLSRKQKPALETINNFLTIIKQFAALIAFQVSPIIQVGYC